jgi:ribosomal-protein-serine acetyltransferase
MVSILIDEDILLRSYQWDDVNGLFAAVTASKKHLRTWLDWADKTTKPEHTQQFIQQSLQQLQSQEGLALGIFYKREIIGGIGMHHWDHTLKKAQLGYWIAAEHEGKGIINRCLVRFVDFLFNKAGLNKIEIHFVAENKRSAHVAQRLGCKIEGVIRQSCLRNGKLEDLVIAGLLKSEWTKD